MTKTRWISFAAVFYSLLIAQLCTAATLGIDQSISDEFTFIWLRGEIHPGDESELFKLVRGKKNIILDLDSLGGDVDTAIKIGLLLRERSAWVTTQGCYSSCALVFAGATQRTGDFSGIRDPIVGVHRVFFTRLSGQSSPKDVKEIYDRQLNHIRAYLAQMNVAPELLSFIQSIAPSEMHIMTREELNFYGIGRSDVIAEEISLANEATRLGTTSLGLRKRESRAKEECEAADFSGQTPSDLEFNFSKMSNLPIQQIMKSTCRLAIRYGVPLPAFRQRFNEADRLCRGRTTQSDCTTQYLLTGQPPR